MTTSTIDPGIDPGIDTTLDAAEEAREEAREFVWASALAGVPAEEILDELSSFYDGDPTDLF